MLISSLLFGNFQKPEFGEDEEFKYKLLIVLITSGALFTLFLIVASDAGANPIHGQHYISMWIFSVASLILWFVVRTRIHLVKTISICFETICLLEYISAFIYVPYDELRILWFFTNIPGVYIMLGKRIGAFVTVLTIFIICFLNQYVDAPYSSNALATLVSAIVYTSIFFHVYVHRSMSYYVRMKESNSLLFDMATVDPLTGLLNARAYYESCDQQISLSNRMMTAYSVLFIDLDHFKKINDTYGHAVGDLVLKQSALCMKSKLRKSDLIGRIGGEEFSVFLPNTNKQNAILVAESLRKQIEQQSIQLKDDKTIHITASIGVSSLDGIAKENSSFVELQKNADSAMYEAKHAGRNRVSVFGQSL